jgi:hypothetical protein
LADNQNFVAAAQQTEAFDSSKTLVDVVKEHAIAWYRLLKCLCLAEKVRGLLAIEANFQKRGAHFFDSLWILLPVPFLSQQW